MKHGFILLPCHRGCPSELKFAKPPLDESVFVHPTLDIFLQSSPIMMKRRWGSSQRKLPASIARESTLRDAGKDSAQTLVNIHNKRNIFTGSKLRSGPTSEHSSRSWNEKEAEMYQPAEIHETNCYRTKREGGWGQVSSNKLIDILYKVRKPTCASRWPS